jgi:hypothetical protein
MVPPKQMGPWTKEEYMKAYIMFIALLIVQSFHSSSATGRLPHRLKKQDSQPADTARLQIHGGNVRFDGIIEFPGSINEFFENIALKGHSFHISGVSFSLPGDMYSIHVDSFFFNGDEGRISISGLRMLPRHSREEFYKHVTHETDRFEFELDNIEINGFRSFHLHGRRAFTFSKMEIKRGTINVFRDRRPPFNEQQRPEMPARLIGTAPVGIHARVVRLSEIDILYSEYPESPVSPSFDESTGEVPFSGLTAILTNITNLPDSLERDSIMQIEAQALIFDSAVLSAEFTYNLKDRNGSFNAAGELTGFPFRSVNPALYQLTGVKVAEGIHSGSVFAFSGNDAGSEGELYMDWSDLSIEFAPDGGEVVRNLTRDIGGILYHSSTPGNSENVPTGKIELERDLSRFVFNFWWKSYLSGVINSVLRDFVPL